MSIALDLTLDKMSIHLVLVLSWRARGPRQGRDLEHFQQNLRVSNKARAGWCLEMRTSTHKRWFSFHKKPGML